MELKKISFCEGQSFNNEEDLFKFYQEFCIASNEPFTIMKHNKNRIVFKCRRGRKRISKSSGLRPNQRYLYCGCEAQINIFKNKTNVWRVMKVNLKHNHKIGRLEYTGYERKNKLESRIITLPQDLKKSQLTPVTVSDEKDGILCVKDSVIESSESFSEEKDELRIFLEKFDKGKGLHKLSRNNDGTVKSLFITSHAMITRYKKLQPPILGINMSLKFKVYNDYKLLEFLYFSLITASFETVAFAFMSKQTTENIAESLVWFQNISLSNPNIIIIYRDFTEVSAISNVFPHSKFIWCQCELLKYMKKFLHTSLVCHIVTKTNIFEMFKKLLHSSSEEEYEEEKTDLLIISNSIPIHFEKQYVPFNEYFLNFWDSCKEMWVNFYRDNLILGSKNSQIDSNFFLTSAHPQNINFSFSYIINRITTISRNVSNTDTTLRILELIDLKPEIKTSLNIAACRLLTSGLCLFKKSLLWCFNQSKNINKYEMLKIWSLCKTSNTKCGCDFWISTEAPCQHILLLRKRNGLELYSDDCFHEKYLYTDNLPK